MQDILIVILVGALGIMCYMLGYLRRQDIETSSRRCRRKEKEWTVIPLDTDPPKFLIRRAGTAIPEDLLWEMRRKSILDTMEKDPKE